MTYTITMILWLAATAPVPVMPADPDPGLGRSVSHFATALAGNGCGYFIAIPAHGPTLPPYCPNCCAGWPWC